MIFRPEDRRPLSRRLLGALALLSVVAAPAHGQADVSPDVFAELDYRYIGPEGNRMSAVVGEPGNSNVAYAGSASGGIFKTIDGGIHWEPIFDDVEVSSIGALALAPSDPNVLWAGTGETHIRSHISIGDGIYKSTDGGATWRRMGLDATGRIARITIDPTNPDVVYAAALGHAYGPQQERGVYRTTDGGETWEQVLFVDEDTGASDIAMDPANPRNLIAGMWPIQITTYLRTSGGPGGGVYRSRDGGDTWERLERGLPQADMGKVGVAYAPSNPDRVYALIETKQYEYEGVLFRSDDGGDSWELISHDFNLQHRPHYYTRLVVAVDDEDEVYFMGNPVWKSIDGGKTVTAVAEVGGDDHDMWIDPLDPDRFLVANDPGVRVSTTRGRFWHTPKLPNAQMYHVAVDNRIPYYVYGNRQDGPSRRGPSNSRAGGRIPIGLWHNVGGGEAGFTYPDPVDPDIIWSATYDGRHTVYNQRTGHTRNVQVWPSGEIGKAPADHRYRWNWIEPIAISPHDHNRVYIGSQFVHMTTNGGESWEIISPDLTLNDKSRQTGSGGLTEDNLGVEIGSTQFAIAESPAQAGVIWVGTNDGLVQLTRNSGADWTDVTGNIPGIPEWGTISNIEPSRFEAGSAYISVDAHQMNDRDPYAYKTTDFGRSWELITAGIPKSVVSYVHVIREDPERQGLLYLGTENALYMSFDDGGSWTRLRNNLPPAPVYWLTIQEHFSDLVVGTYGRGFWILDDITAIRQLDASVLDAAVHLFEPRAAYRFASVQQVSSVRSDADGFNPTYGASINYHLKDVPTDSVTIDVLEGGTVIRTLTGSKDPGINRVYWDLRHEALEPARIRTAPLGHPEPLPEYLQYNDEGWRPMGEVPGPLVVPGTFTLRLRVGDIEQSQTLEVRKDPNTEGTIADIQEQNRMLFQVRELEADQNEMISALEWVRKQIEDLRQMTDDTEALEAADDYYQAVLDIEGKFFQLTQTGRGDDGLRAPGGLAFSRLRAHLASADFGPTAQAYEVYDEFAGEMQAYREQFSQVVGARLRSFNTLVEGKGLPRVVIPGREIPRTE